MEFRGHICTCMHAPIIGRAIASRRIRSRSFRRGIFMASRRGCRHLHRLRNIYVLRSCRASVSDISLSLSVWIYVVHYMHVVFVGVYIYGTIRQRGANPSF
jgi:hypothetical protein